MPDLILASASPRRLELLSSTGLRLRVHAADVDESRRPGEHPVHLARRLAESKARAVLRSLVAAAQPEMADPVLAADTVVHARMPGEQGAGAAPPPTRVYGKPQDAQDAERILAELSGRWHAVTTGFCILCGERATVGHVTTRVRFRPLSAALIRQYVASKEPLDKAGAYGIQGAGAVLTDRIEGSYTNVVGLPLAEVLAALQRLDLLPGS